MNGLTKDLLLALLWKMSKSQNPVEVTAQDIQDFIDETAGAVGTRVSPSADGGYTIKVAPASRILLEELAPESMPSC